MLHHKPRRKRGAALLLSALMLFASVHFTPPAAAGNEWVMDSVNKLTSWGVITGRDTGDRQLNAVITRAEITAMVNRAYGYTEVGEIPFTDVPSSAWYADDIAIGYNTGYFSGTTETTASPDGSLTREQAIALMARNLRLPESTGEVTQFTDGRTFSTWSMGYIKAAAENGLINGYSDGSFRPKNEITRAEMIKLLADSVGQLVNAPGTHTLGGVVGNVTINTAGCTLVDTTIGGDLYLTGGVGMGGVTLDNVNVLGRIIVAGGGESEGGGESIVLRNVSAQSMLVDSMAGQYVSMSIQNDTLIPETTLKSNAFIEDFSRGGMGLQRIVMDGDPEAEEPMNVTLSGNIKTVVNRTPESHLTIGDGTAENVTIDERAVDSTLTITNDGVVDTLNLDVGIAVDGEGAIGNLYVNAPGASTSMLPDNIVIRPGITANIAGTVMDTKLGEESSSDPRILAGYPRADDIAPNSALAVFSGNKAGTIHYAVTPEQYGPVEDDDILVNPPTYGPTYTARGTLAIAKSETEASVRISGLVPDGTYYLSATLVDARGDRSPIKWVKFTTPDNTVPNFTTGYPTLSKITDIDAQLSAMTNKDCEMYYAIYPRGSVAPTANSFLSNSLEGNIANGIFKMKKNTPLTEWLTGTPIAGGAGSINGLLKELTDYDLYLWLTDREGGLSSAVRKIQFRTVDVTPPEFVTLPYVTNEAARAVTLTGSLNENGTIYWVAVPEGEMYPKPASNPNIDTGAHAVTVTGGTGGGTYRTGDLVTIVPETTTSDVFYRWSVEQGGVTVSMVSPDGDSQVVQGTATFRMPDEAVSVTAYFISKEDADNGTDNPRLIRGTTITSGSGVALDSEYAKLQVRNGMNAFKRGSTSAREMADFNFTVSGLDPQTRYDVYYVAVDTAGNFSNTVHKITVNTLDNIAPTATQEFTRFADGDTVNTTHPYANTDIRLIFSEEVTTTHSTRSFLELYQDVVAARNNPAEWEIARETLGSALASSIQLYTTGLGGNVPQPVGDDVIDFRKAIVELEDDGKMVITFQSTSNPDSDALNLRSGATYFFRLKDITDTSTARNRMGQTDLPRFTTISAQVFLQSTNTTTINGFYNPDQSVLEADIAFSLTPRSTSTMDDSVDWDMLLWLNQSADFDLYRRVGTGSWSRLGSYTIDTSGTTSGGISIRQYDSEGNFPQLNQTLKDDGTVYEYAVHFTKIGNLDDRTSWSQNMIMQVNILAGGTPDLRNVAANVTDGYEEAVKGGEVADIGTPVPFRVRKQFADQSPPHFVGNYPRFEPGDTNVIIDTMLDRSGPIYWMIAPVGVVLTEHADDRSKVEYDQVPNYGGAGDPPALYRPTYRQIIDPRNNGISSDRIQFGTTNGGTSEISWSAENLETDTEYFAYFVIQGNGQIYSDVMIYGFKTEPVIVPHYTLTLSTPTNVTITEEDNRRNSVNYKLIASTALSSFGGGILQRTLNVGSRSMTVLEALTGDDPSGLSYFDVYADDALKRAMALAIRSRDSDGTSIIGNGNATLPGMGNETVECAERWNLSEGVQYIFLSVGQTVTSISSNDPNNTEAMAFRAIAPVRLDDIEAPKVIMTQPDFNRTGTGSNMLFSGTCTVNFNENIYKFNGNDKPPIPIDTAPSLVPSPPGPRNDDFASIQSLLAVSSQNSKVQLIYNVDQYQHYTASIALSFTNLRLNEPSSITFTTDFTDAKPNRRQTPLTITLTPQATQQDAQGNWIYGIVVTVSPEWDARPGSDTTKK